MYKRKIVMSILIPALILFHCGCNNARITDNPGKSNLPTPFSATSSIYPTLSNSTSTPTASDESVQTLNERSMNAYQKFLNDEATISFDRFMPNGTRLADGDSIKKGREYKLSEILQLIRKNYFYPEGKKIGYIEYSYIDCGKDGVSELALSFNNLDIYSQDDDSSLYFIIKYIDEKLYLCYSFETWARSDSAVNVYGYYESDGKAGAGTVVSESGFIDREGKWHPITYVITELNIRDLVLYDNLKDIPELAEKNGITDQIEFQMIYLDNNSDGSLSDELNNDDCFYTFYVGIEGQGENSEIYTKSLFKKIFDEASVPITHPDEIAKRISEKEKQAGVTAEIKEGERITWNRLDGKIFTEHVENS